MNSNQKQVTLDEVHALYHMPLLDLVFRAAAVHREFHNAREVQMCSLLSVKTGGCPEDCAYCPQSAHHNVGMESQPLMDVNEVIDRAKAAKEAGAQRYCLGAAWRSPNNDAQFEDVLTMVRGIKSLGLQVCCTLGMLTAAQAVKLKEAGLYAYNHNLDTSEEYYKKIITTRTYQDRLDTIQVVRDAGLTVCCGGILGMGETHDDRIKLLHTLSQLSPQPESVPINAFVRVEGTPLHNQPQLAVWDMVRAIATARIVMPKTMVRLSAGRTQMTDSDQALCFLAGANSVFIGEKLLTTDNPNLDDDKHLFDALGVVPIRVASAKNLNG